MKSRLKVLFYKLLPSSHKQYFGTTFRRQGKDLNSTGSSFSSVSITLRFWNFFTERTKLTITTFEDVFNKETALCQWTQPKGPRYCSSINSKHPETNEWQTHWILGNSEEMTTARDTWCQGFRRLKKKKKGQYLLFHCWVTEQWS